uniref:Uncharacterized protein n=1 Tax=Geospiza parvula TaxID=87175 RepID=A0A8C3QAZ8_GEOPR
MSSTPAPVPKPLLPSPPHTEAARQLDELLADLGHTQSKVSLGPGAPGWGVWPSPRPHILLPNSWQLQGRELGPSLASHRASSLQALTALGKTWHPEHFTCARCGQELDKGPFFEQGGQAFCEEDYHQAFSPRCAYCASPIREVIVMALEQTWHPEHFFCAHCGKRNGKPYCHQDFLALFAPKCQGCERPVIDNYLSALQGVWHAECFVCTVSGMLEGRPYCELHFHHINVPGTVPADPNTHPTHQHAWCWSRSANCPQLGCCQARHHSLPLFLPRHAWHCSLDLKQ